MGQEDTNDESNRIVETTPTPQRHAPVTRNSAVSDRGDQLAGSGDSWEALVSPALFTQTSNGQISWANSHFERLTDLTWDQWNVEISYWDVVHESDVESVQKHWQECRKSSAPQRITYRTRFPKREGVTWISETRRCVASKLGANEFEVFWQDVTTRCMAETRMASSTWQRSLASLTPGITHDLNNHFASILALSDNFVRRFGEGHPHVEGMKTIRDSVQQANRLLQQLVALHFGRPAQRQYVNLNEFVAAQLAFLRHTFPRRVGFDQRLSEGSLFVHADPQELQRTLITLIKNAVEAIPFQTQGTIVFTTLLHKNGLPGAGSAAGEMLPKALVTNPSFDPSKSWISLTVSDDGPGVSPGLQSRLFHPWFSTKSPSEASGLGLALAQSFAKNSGGIFTFDSCQPKGAALTLWLPLSALNESDRPPVGFRPCLLLVGEEPRLTEVSLLLRDAGLAVTATQFHGLEILEETDTPFDGILLMEQVSSYLLAALVGLARSRRWRSKVIFETPTGRKPEDIRPDLTLPAPIQGSSTALRIRKMLMESRGYFAA